MVEAFRERRDYVLERLRRIPGVVCRRPAGAFYVFPNVAAFYDRLPPGAGARGADPSVRLAEYLLQEAHVAVVPGAAFGASENIRLSYALGLEEIARGMDALEAALGRIAAGP